MRAHKVSVTVPHDHRLEVRLPAEFPSGPAEVIVLSEPSEHQSRQTALAAVEQLRSTTLTSEEEEILDGFEAFRSEHPFSLSSLTES